MKGTFTDFSFHKTIGPKELRDNNIYIVVSSREGRHDGTIIKAHKYNDILGIVLYTTYGQWTYLTEETLKYNLRFVEVPHGKLELEW